MVAVILLQVICRYLLNNSLFWSEELARMLLVQITFLGAAAAFHGRLHIVVNIITSTASPQLRRLLDTICILVCAALFATMLVYGLDFCQTLRLQRAASLPVSLTVPFAVIPISGGIMLLHCLGMLTEHWIGPTPPSQTEPCNSSSDNPDAGA
jgi:TRAP-type C4-dicarboxylate transport system permease small subunit